MNEILAFYHKQAEALTSSIPWLASLQNQALKQLSQSGFPSRRDEDWKYTSVDDLLNQFFVQQNRQSSKTMIQESGLPLPSSLVLHNGFIAGIETLQSQLPSGVLVLPLALALVEHADLIKPYLGHILKVEHGFHHLNTAMIHFGVFIHIPEGVHLSAPLVITHYQDEPQALHLRHVIIAEAQSEATIVEAYHGQKNCNYLINTISELFLGANAKLTHYKIQKESKSAYHIGQLSVKQSNKSQFASHCLSLGGKLSRSDISIHLQETQAQCLMNGIYAPSQGQHMDHHTSVYHEVPDCKSEQDYKGILTGHSRAVFNGKVFVAKDAQHTDAKQQNKNLLLSSEAEVDTKPQLEIFADDVYCSHGATVGQLDEDALFYLMTRGIGQVEATQYLVQAFTASNISLIPNKDLKEWVNHNLFHREKTDD